jgi:hypothetical protein
MIVLKGSQSSSSFLRRSKNSLTSLSQTCASDLSQAKLKRSSSSLYLQGLVIDSSSLTSSSSSSLFGKIPSEPKVECAEGPSTAVAYSTSRSLDENEGGTLIQAMLMLMALQMIPSYFSNVAQIFQLQCHCIQLLIALGVFPTMFLKFHKGIKANSRSNNLDVVTQLKPDAEVMSSGDMTDLYRKYASREFTGAEEEGSWGAVTAGPEDADVDWDFFADFNETPGEQDLPFLISSNLPSRSSLHTLQETEEEDAE